MFKSYGQRDLSSLDKKYIIGAVAILAIAIASYIFINKITLEKQKKEQLKKEQIEKEKETQAKHLRYRLTNTTVIIPTQSNKFFKRMDVKVDATLEIVLFKESSELYFGMQFDKFDYILDKKALQKSDRLLLEPFLVSLSSGGIVDDILFSNKLKEQHRRQISGLIKTLQIHIEDNRDSWTTSEENNNGTYESNYICEQSKSIKNIQKTNTEYIAYSKDQTEIEILKSDILATIDSKPWIRKLSYTQEELYGVRNRPMMSSKIITKLDRVAKINNRMLISTFTTLKALREYLNRSVVKKKVKSAKQVSSAKTTIEIFFSCMKLGRCNFLNIKENLLIYLVAHPEDMHIILDMIKDSKYKNFHHQLINMLLELGTPEAQQTMIDIIKSSDFSSSNRGQAAMSIGFLQEPTRETIVGLRELYESGLLSQNQEISIYLALGNLASSSQEVYEQITTDIISDLEISSSTQEIVAALGAMENTENNDVIKYVTPYLSSVNRAVRKGAVQALRLTPSPGATQALYSQLKVEEYDLVINAIAYSLHNKKDLSPKIIKEVAVKTVKKIKKSNDTMMLKAVDFLVDKSKKNRDAKDALKKMMGKGLSVEVRKRIIRGL